ncbi:segregation/condensation protein A, partial [Halorubrum sp. AJ67]|uniref:segregation/condensation protein A n=1 Tax=Halorubrum sp. AJ67 TaxID=1173487 RepID=UPI00064FD4FB
MTEDGVPDLDLTSERDGADPFADESSDDGPSGDKMSGNEGSNPGDDPAPGPDVAGVSPPDETDDDEVEPVELLVQLAEEGEIEPWDIDIVQVTDAFLEKLDETDLRTTGRALFYASVLLRMKSDGMLADDDEDEEPEPEPWKVAMEGGAPDPADGDFD